MRAVNKNIDILIILSIIECVMINKGVVMKTRYDDAIFKFKRRVLETATWYVDNKDACELIKSKSLYQKLKGLRHKACYLSNEQLYQEFARLKYSEKDGYSRYIKEYHLSVYENINTIQENPSAMNLKEVTWFSNSRGDFGAMFVTQELYNSIIHYYRYSAKYNLKDERLENAIKDWENMVNPKPTLKELLSKLFKGKQK